MKSIMVFEVNGQLFGYETGFIKESVTVEKVFPVPNSKDFIKGIFNLRNNPIPLIDLGLLLYKNPLNSDIVIVVEKESKISGILIERLKGVIQVDEDKIYDIENIALDDLNKEFFSGYFQHNNEIILLLKLDPLFDVKKCEIKSKNFYSANKGSGEKEQNIKNSSKGYIIFQIEKEWFAINVDVVQEILSFPENISTIPDNPNWLKGLFLLRNSSVVLIDLAEFLGISTSIDRERVILAKINNMLVGISVPYVKEIRWIDKDAILSIENNSLPNKGIIPLDNGKRLVLILDVENIFNINLDEVLKGESQEEVMVLDKKDKNVQKYLHFRVGDIHMAINIKEVQEVVEFSTINELPKAPDYIIGMMNLRNSVITVISLDKRLNIEDSSKNIEDKRIIVLSNSSVSLLVDSLEGILSLGEDEIYPPDENIDIEEKYLNGIAKAKNDRLIFILNIKNLISKDDS